MDKTAQATPTKEWVDYRVRVKLFPQTSFFCHLVGREAGRQFPGGGRRLCMHIYSCKQSKEHQEIYQRVKMTMFHTIYFIQIIKALMCLKFTCRVSILIQILVVL